MPELLINHAKNDEAVSLGARPVWVLNRDTEPYSELFNGQTIVIPPNSEKKIKMPFLEARLFLGRGAPVAYQNTRGDWIQRPKALYTEEIMETDTQEVVVHKTKEVAVKYKCFICEAEFDTSHGIKIHMGSMHSLSKNDSNRSS